MHHFSFRYSPTICEQDNLMCRQLFYLAGYNSPRGCFILSNISGNTDIVAAESVKFRVARQCGFHVYNISSNLVTPNIPSFQRSNVPRIASTRPACPIVKKRARTSYPVIHVRLRRRSKGASVQATRLLWTENVLNAPTAPTASISQDRYLRWWSFMASLSITALELSIGLLL